MSSAFDRPLPRAGDVYPSRFAAFPRLIQRQDPILYAEEPAHTSSSCLSQEQLTAHEEQGFLFFPALFSALEVDFLRLELARLAEHPDADTRPEFVWEPNSRSLRSVFGCHRLSDVFATLCCDPRLLRRVKAILAGDVYVHQSRVNYKPGCHGEAYFWHSDFENEHVEDGLPHMRALSVSIFLHENTLFNGPLMLIPGSHRWYVSCVGKTPNDHWKQALRAQSIGCPDFASLQRLVEMGGIVAPTGPAGSVLLFDCNTMHGSNSNISPLPRSNAFFVYNSVHNLPEAPFSGQEPRPEFLATRSDFSPLLPKELKVEQ